MRPALWPARRWREQGLTPPPGRSPLCVTAEPAPKKKMTPKTADRFDEFWTFYPKKVQKKVALRCWRANGLDAIADTIIGDVQARQRQDDGWKRGFIPNPSTYLNQERWTDQICARPVERTVATTARASEGELVAMGTQLGIFAKPGESLEEYRRRIMEGTRR